MAEIIYTSEIHPTEQMVLDAAAQNLQPSSVLLPLVLRAALPGDTRNKDFAKHGKFVREVLAENVASTYQAYTETKTQLTAIKSVVSFRNSVESLDFSAGDLPTKLGKEAATAFAIGLDEDISDLFFTASKTQAHSGSGYLKLIDILAAALKVRKAINGQDEIIAFVGELKQLHEVFGTDLLTNTGQVFGNSAQDLPKMGAQQKGAGYMGTFSGIATYQSSVIDTQTVSAASCYVGAVFAPSRAFVGMWGKEGMLSNDDTVNIRKAKAAYMYSDFGIHWDEALCSVTSPVA